MTGHPLQSARLLSFTGDWQDYEARNRKANMEYRLRPFASLWYGPRAERDRPEHGTYAGYRLHRRDHQTPCDPCRTAQRAHTAELQTARRLADRLVTALMFTAVWIIATCLYGGLHEWHRNQGDDK